MLARASKHQPAGSKRMQRGKANRFRYSFDLLRELVVRDLKLRYKRSVLGIAWSLLNPLLQLAVFGFVFGYLIPLKVPDFTLFLFIGILVWTWFQASLYAATGAIVDNPTLIRQPGFPVGMLPVITVMSNTVNFLLALPVLLISLWIGGHLPTRSMLALPLVILLQFVLTLGISYFLAMLHVSFRDTQYMLGIALMLGFYLVPIFYDAASLPARYQPIYHLNPVVGIVEAYRAILLHGNLPPMLPLLVIGLVSCVLLALGSALFVRASYRFVEEL